MASKQRLKIIDSITIPSPCTESWAAMRGDAARRYCDHCSHFVTDISTLTRSEAESLLMRGAAEKICIRYRKNSAGEIQFKPQLTPRLKISRAAQALFITLLTAVGMASKASAAEGGAGQDAACEQSANSDAQIIEKMGKPAAPDVVMGSPAVPETIPESRDPEAQPDTRLEQPNSAADPAAPAVLGRVKVYE